MELPLMIKLEGSVQLIRTYKSPSLKLARCGNTHLIQKVLLVLSSHMIEHVTNQLPCHRNITKHFNKIYAKFIKIQFHVQ